MREIHGLKQIESNELDLASSGLVEIPGARGRDTNYATTIPVDSTSFAIHEIKLVSVEDSCVGWVKRSADPPILGENSWWVCAALDPPYFSQQ
jgi:hypothetical protein